MISNVQELVWPKWGLRIPTMHTKCSSPRGVQTWWIETFGFERKDDAERYLFLVECCNHSVASFLEDNEDIAKKFMNKELGYLYFDILKMCGADDKWGKEAYELISKGKIDA